MEKHKPNPNKRKETLSKPQLTATNKIVPIRREVPQVKMPDIQTIVNVNPSLVFRKIKLMLQYSPTRGRNYAKAVLQKKEK